MSVSSKLGGLFRRLRAVPPPAAISAVPEAPAERWGDQFTAPGATAAAWVAQRRARGRLYADLPQSDVDCMRSRFPDQVARTCRAADRACRHEFDLLGSGPYVPVDPDRPRGADGYAPIDWALDPISGLRFPTGFRLGDWRPEMRPGLADIKLPWEIGRCQHWPTLGQAFRLTGDERYAQEIVRQLADFLEVNPVGIGVQYVCTMDVAIRALNWAIAFEMIRASRAFEPAAESAYRSLFDVGLFVEGHLENKYEVTSNHFLSNVVGLYGLGVLFGDLPAGQRWRRQGREWLEQEIRVQVLEDGADYESSIPYHRLVAELFLSGARLAECEGEPLSPAYLDRLRRMIDFFIGVLRPDGLLPQVGDADDGRVHIFTDFGTWLPQDARHLIAPAASMLREPSWLAYADDDSLWEAAWWGAGIAPAQGAAAADARAGRLFEHAGIAVARSPRAYLIATNGRVGTNGFGNHKHNDLLGFEFHGDGVPLFVDPGSYVYTSDPDSRNLFRGTAYHNTIAIDGAEQNDIRPDYLFRMFETSTIEHCAFEDSAACTEYRGRHTGYRKLTAPVTHERAFRVLKHEGALLIEDRLTGSGHHALRWHVHLAPGVTAEADGPHAAVLIANGRRWRFRADAALEMTVSDAWYSPSYGVRTRCRAIDLAASHDVSDRTYAFAIGPEAWAVTDAAAAAQAAFAARLQIEAGAR